MNNTQVYVQTKRFDTVSECRKLTKWVKNKIFQGLHLDRNKTRLSHGLVLLYGLYIDDNGKHYWNYLSDTITEFPEYIKDDTYHKYFLKTKIVSKSK